MWNLGGLGSNPCPCTGRQTLNHWTLGLVQDSHFNYFCAARWLRAASDSICSLCHLLQLGHPADLPEVLLLVTAHINLLFALFVLAYLFEILYPLEWLINRYTIQKILHQFVLLCVFNSSSEMVGWHHQLNAYEFGWTPGVGDGQGGLPCCGSWGCKKSQTQLGDWTELNWTPALFFFFSFFFSHLYCNRREEK